MITIEGDKNSLVITILESKGEGFVGTSADISKEALINELMKADVLEDGETVFFDEESG